MKIFKAYISAWRNLFTKKKLVFHLYLISLLFVMLVFLPLRSYFSDSIGNSNVLTGVNDLFDYTLISDLLNKYGGGIKGILSVSKWILLLFFLLFIFLTGGILESIKHKKYDSNLLLVGGSKYYWRIFFMSLFFIICQCSLLFVFFAIFRSSLGGVSPFGIETDSHVSGTIKLLLPFYLFLMMFLSLISDLAKVDMIHHEKSIFFKHIGNGIKQIASQFLSLVFLYIFWAISFSLIFYLNRVLQAQFSNTIGWLLVVPFIVGQLFILFRISIKIMILSSLDHLYNQNHDRQITV